RRDPGRVGAGAAARQAARAARGPDARVGSGMKVLVVGAGNIGTTLANILLAHRRVLGLSEVLVQKVREPAPFDAPDLAELERRGARVVRATTPGAAADLCASVGYVFDCRKDGAAVRDRCRYLDLATVRAASAQG